ncbi:MAG: Unknown protein [uncultured Sulfurovum sp.]|uniref:Uncharacterized protein n=1 Tax=uncultured Sulfurovum sp. TaxID=269237 RepID=A0A6S6TIN3_9BACT|nr:MAG: Unknown protein [uncultured Sulfurovum sp.]
MEIIKSDFIRDKLSYIESKVKNDTKQKLYGMHVTAEYIFMNILNDVYGWKLINANDEKSNFPAIDLIDTSNDIVIQVTFEITAKKVRDDTIDKFHKLVKIDEYKKYADYKIKMFYIKSKPNFSDKILEEFKEKGMFPSDLLGIEDINSKVCEDPKIATKVFETLCDIFHDNVCNSHIPQNLTTKLGKSTIIGRKVELKDIEDRLNSSKALVLHGIGGMGKSTIAGYYLHQHKNEFDYYGFFEGLDEFINELERALKLNIEQGQDRLSIILHELTKLNGNKFLVIDNIQELTENKKIIKKILDLKEHDGFQILLTSREEIEDIDKYTIDTLSMRDAKELFNSIYKVEDEILLEDILEYLDCHAFFVEKTAMSIKKTLTPQMIRDKFENGEFSKVSVKRKESFNTYLNQLYTLDALDEEETLMLKQLSILPSIEIEFSFLQEMFSREDSDFEELLDYLCEQGWLIKNDESYKLHQIIKEFLLANYAPCFEEIEGIVDSFNQFLKDSVDVHIALAYRNKIIYFISLLQVSERMKFIKEKTAMLFRDTSNIYYNLGNHKEAFPLMHKAISMFKVLFGDEHLSTAICYNNLGLLYFSIGKSIKAKELYEISLQLTEGLPNKEDKYIASIYNNLGEVDRVLGLYDGAENHFLKALELDGKLLEKNQINIAKIYNNLGEVYRQKVQYETAHDYYMKSLKINEDIFTVYHPIIATNYNNLGLLYSDMEQEEDAERCYYKALEINYKIWGERHTSVAMSANNLAGHFYKRELYDKAIELYFKALVINEEILGVEHHVTIMNIANLAEVYRCKKIYRKAEYFYFEALVLYKKIWGEEHLDIASIYHNLGRLYFDLKDLKKSYEYMSNAYKMRKSFLVNNHPLVLQSIQSLKIIDKALVTVAKNTKNAVENQNE